MVVSGVTMQVLAVLLGCVTAVDTNPDDLHARLYLASAWMSPCIPGGGLPGNSGLARHAEAEFQQVLRLDGNNKTALASLAALSYQESQGIPDQDAKFRKLGMETGCSQKEAAEVRCSRRRVRTALRNHSDNLLRTLVDCRATGGS
jgi:hypothetical protein